MYQPHFWQRSLGWLCGGLFILLLGWAIAPTTALAAAGVDNYVIQYLKVTDSVELPLNERGETKTFTAVDLTRGKRLFEENCKNCHVGGSTLPNPLVSLSLKDLKGATPPRDTIASLVAFQRSPMSYDGSEESYSCRRVSEDWLTTEQLETLAAFILRAAAVAPGWGVESFPDSAP